MKKTLLIIGLLGLCTLSAQPVLLPEALVQDSLLPFFSTGHHKTVVDLPLGHTDVGQQLAGKSPLMLNQAAPGLLASYYLRGSYSDGVQVFWNGMPVNSPTLGSTDLNLISPQSFNQIIVLPGGSGPELGSGAVGGSVFFNDVIQLKKTHQLQLESGLGANGYKAVSGAYQLSNEKRALGIKLFYDAADNDFTFTDAFGEEQTRLNNAYERSGASLSGRFRIGKALLTSNFLVQNIYREIPASSTAINPRVPAKAWQTDEVYRMQNVLEYKGWVVEQGFNLERQVYSDVNSDIYSLNDFNHYASEIRKELLSKNGFRWEVGAYLNAYTANGTNVNQGQNEYGVRTDFTHKIGNRFLQKLSLSSDFIDNKSMRMLDSSAYTSIPILPSWSAQYMLTSNIMLRSSVAEVFNNPTLNERFWPAAGVSNIQPESGYSAEVGLDYTSNLGKVKSDMHLTGFYLRLKNRIRWINTGGLLFRPQNVSQSESSGIEYSHKLSYVKGKWQGMFSYNFNYTRAIVLEDEVLGTESEGKQLIYMPLILAGGQLELTYSSLSLYLSPQYNSGAFTTSDNDPFSKLSSFWVWNAGITYGVGWKKWQLKPRISVFNISDTEYQTRNFQPMPGIQFYFNFTLNYQL
jgi:iron complex outermembrane receptor protein